MVKPVEYKFTSNKIYINAFGERDLTENELIELYNFNDSVGFNYDRIEFLVQCIKLEKSDWVRFWNKLKQYSNSTLEYHQLRYGIEEGKLRYESINSRKTIHFDHSSETQRRKGLQSAELSRGNKEWSIRGIGYWMKKGLSEEDAIAKVKDIQGTNTLDVYIKKFGNEDGTRKFIERRERWTEHMSDPEIGKKRSLGLDRYIERYGAVEGERKYIAMRKKRNDAVSIGCASAESLNAFTDIIDLLSRNGIKYYMGVEGNKEWYIYDFINKKTFFYDLTIPFLSIIIEYHGEAFHPNPKWEQTKLEKWKQTFTNKPHDAVLNTTTQKNMAAQKNGWELFEIFSSEVKQTIPNIIARINQLGYY
jgi:hypothetical protein